MRKIVDSIHPKTKSFYVIHEGKKVGFYLTSRLAKTFYDYIQPGVLVDFEITSRKKKLKQALLHQVAHFTLIKSLDPHRVYFDLNELRKEMKKVLLENKYYLFIDFEMTMPGYRVQTFCPQIIQVGYCLAESSKDPLLTESIYILPKDQDFLSKRTKRFLKLDETEFFQKANEYPLFYESLKKVMDQYHPKLVVWGKNDMTALHESYKIHNVAPLTKDQDFIDLLKLHKDFFNLKDDLGLFKAYKAYYDLEHTQLHDAKDDALITKYVFDAFISYI
jgi:sporulation inhibitor KapD